uniref:M56 family metallopeptidase n=1 Tax=uncultured Draconibacterium sp. TaxID=1573823 RepID=UPI003217B80C
MEALLIYLANASAGIVLFYSVYWLFLRNETFHTANRIYLIAGLISATALPFFPIHYSVFVEAENSRNTFQSISDTFKNIPVFSPQAETSTNISWQQAALMVYITGAGIFLLRLLIQTTVLIHLMIKHRIKSFNGVRILENEKYGLPFSFFNIVFINPKFHTQDDLPEILAHEKVHIRENHWFDLLFIELLTVIFWFNPFIWLFERSIKQNHEYLADKGVLAQGHTVGRYQALLVNQLMGMQIIGITNNLNFALSTNRLKMMTKKKTSAHRLIRFTWALPALALLLFAFAEPSYRAKDANPRGEKTSSEKTLSKKTIKMAGLVFDENNKPMPGVSIVIKGSTVGCVSDLNGTFKLEIPEDASIVLSFVGKETIVDNYKGITSGNKKGAVFFRKYHMKDVVIMIDTQVPPPPPPPIPNTTKETGTPPPPPPPPANGKAEQTKLKKGEQEKEVFFIVEDMPQYPGGQVELALLVQKMQKKLAKEKKVNGKAKVMFTVDSKGKVTDIKVVEKDNDMAAKGAYIIAKEMKDWTPGYQRGKAVPVKYLLPVEFK